MSVEDYNILNILGNSINSATYKVQNKESKEIFVWKTIDCEEINDKNIKIIIDNINKRKDISHPNILKFYKAIEQKEYKTFYIVTEFVENGSLKDIIHSCLTNNTYLSEELVCRILYQIAFTFKTTENYEGSLKCNEIFLDENFNVKLLNFNLDYKSVNFSKELKMCNLGLAMYEACTLKAFEKDTFEHEIKRINELFSNDFLSLLVQMIKDTGELKKHINKVLCHPTVLLKSSQWKKEHSFWKVNVSEKKVLSKNDQSEKSVYASKLEKLRNKENALQIREQKIKEMEHKLAVRERKVALMERGVKERIQQAELYLKRCREGKSNCSASSKSSIPSQPEKKLSYENLDSTYVSCGDSIILPTTTNKLNINKIMKPAPFTRTLSERRVRFKGHSPLKEINYNKRKSIRLPKVSKESLIKKTNSTNSSEWSSCLEDEKSSIEGNNIKVERRKSRQLFPPNTLYENKNLIGETQCKPTTWTEENKKYAFELLRFMNSDKENHSVEVKHTYL